MSMSPLEYVKFEKLHDSLIDVKCTIGESRVPYDLVAPLVDVDGILLTLMDRYAGACMKAKGDYMIDCDGVCETCEHSIFHEASLRQRAYRARANTMLNRVVKKGDVWEISYIFNYGDLKHQTYKFECLRTDENAPTIINITHEFIRSHHLDIVHGVKEHYFKVQRFDMSEPMDCSSSGHWRLVEKYKATK